MRGGGPARRYGGTAVRCLALGLLAALPANRLTAQCPDGTPPPCRGARAAAPAPVANSVAVLYFDNRSRDSSDAYLAEGLTEAIITKLGDLPRLTVKSRFVVGRYRGSAAQADPAAVARSLGVTYLVTGSIQRAGSRVRVTAEMSRAASGDRVWGEQYDRGDGDVLAIQEDIARGVATGIAGRLLPAEAARLAARPTRNNAAYDHLLRGDQLLAQRTASGTSRAIAEYAAAVGLDPSLASGWAKIGLAEALRLEWSWGDGSVQPDSVLTNGLAAADRALAIDSLSSDGWMARGYLMMFRNPRDLAGMEAGLRRAVALNPRNAEAWQQLGDHLRMKAAGHPGRDSLRQEAIADYRRALDIEPGRPTTLRWLASMLPVGVARLAILDSAIASDPSSYPALEERARLLLALGDTAGTRAALARAEGTIDPSRRTAARANLAAVRFRVGDTTGIRAEAESLLRDLPPGVPIHPYVAAALASLFATLGDTARTVDMLDRQPRGAFAWAVNWATVTPDLLRDPRARRIWDENRPPWAR